MPNPQKYTIQKKNHKKKIDHSPKNQAQNSQQSTFNLLAQQRADELEEIREEQKLKELKQNINWMNRVVEGVFVFKKNKNVPGSSNQLKI